MRAAGIVGVSRRRGVTTTRRDRDARPAPDLVDRNFTAGRPNQLRVADITYVPTMAGFLYLAVVLDAFSRRIVGWAMETHLRTELVLAALEMAIGQRKPSNVIHHSDQGTQYTSLAFGGRCREAGVRPSMGSVSGTPTTTLCARASSPPWNASCWHAAGSHRRPRPGWQSSVTSRGGTIPPVAIPASAIYPQSPTRCRCSGKPKRLNDEPSFNRVNSNSLPEDLPFAPPVSEARTARPAWANHSPDTHIRQGAADPLGRDV